MIGTPQAAEVIGHRLRRGTRQKAEIVAAGRFMVGREPGLLGGRDRPQVDLLPAELHAAVTLP